MRKATHKMIMICVLLSISLGIILQSHVQALPGGASSERGSNSRQASSRDVQYELYYLDYAVNPDLTVTFRYWIKAHDRPINAWALYSGCFVKGALVNASEPVVYKPDINCLRFVRAVTPNEERVVTFTLRTGYYTSYRLSEIYYYVRLGSRYDYGQILGPTPIPSS